MKYRFTFKLSTGETMFHDAKTMASAKKWVKSMGWIASEFRQISKYPVI
jgi:hypothetical protein